MCWRFNRADTFTFDGVISGAGSLHHIGPGTTILTGNHTYTGATLIGRGTVQVGAGSTTGRLGRGAIVNNGTLVFDRSDAVMVDHPISGSGALIQASTGTLFLSGAHWYGGGTSVRAGALRLDGSLVGPVDVAAGATFNGVGSIGGSLTVNGTMIIAAPDGTHGALHIGENLTLASGSRAFMTLEASGGHSLLTAGGRAIVGGASLSVVTREGNYARATFYPFLYASGGVAGTLIGHDDDRGRWNRSSPHVANPVVLTLLNTALPLAPAATTAAGASIGGVFDRLRAHATGDLALVMRELTALDDAGLGAALDSAAGAVHASAALLSVLDSEAATDVVRRELSVRGGPETSTGTGIARLWPNGPRAWVSFQGQQTELNASSGGADARLSGVLAGADGTLGERWFAGVGGGYTTGDLSLDGRV